MTNPVELITCPDCGFRTPKDEPCTMCPLLDEETNND